MPSTRPQELSAPIGLMDGGQLAGKFKELRPGIKTEMVEGVEVNADRFRASERRSYESQSE